MRAASSALDPGTISALGYERETAVVQLWNSPTPRGQTPLRKRDDFSTAAWNQAVWQPTPAQRTADL